MIAEITGTVLLLPQPEMPKSTAAKTVTESPQAHERLRGGANSQPPKLNASTTSEPSRCIAEPPDAVKVTTVEMAAVPEGVTIAGLKPHEIPTGSPEQPNVTAVLKPLTGVTIRFAVFGADLVTTPTFGLIASEKSGAGGGVIVTVTTLEVDATKLRSPL